VETASRLIQKADGLIEGLRPGVMERLGLGPEECLSRNGRLVYGRMTGWGQNGPLSSSAGHDINYIALSGALYPMGDADRPPVPPLNLLGDFGGGGMMLAFGMVCALLHARTSGTGQIVDANVVEGTAALSTLIHGLKAMGVWTDERAENMLDGSAPFYSCYICKGGGYVAVGALEAKFYNELCLKIGVVDFPDPDRLDKVCWPEMRKAFTATFVTRTRDEWAGLFEGTDACVTPVLTLAEAVDHPHNRARGSFITPNGIPQPAPVPRLSKTPGAVSHPPPLPGEHSEDILSSWGVQRT
jgi:alpha-methylacyl-CoA racemase